MNELAQVKLAGWAEMARRRNESGLSVSEWCAENGMTENSYYYRIRKLREAALEGMRGGAPGQAAQFAKVTLPASQQAPAALTVRIGDVTMELADGASGQVIALVREAILHAV